MKVNLTFKTPDIVEDAIREAQQELERTASEAAAEMHIDSLRRLSRQFFHCGEYCTVELDTDAGTCTVVPVA